MGFTSGKLGFAFLNQFLRLLLRGLQVLVAQFLRRRRCTGAAGGGALFGQNDVIVVLGFLPGPFFPGALFLGELFGGVGIGGQDGTRGKRRFLGVSFGRRLLLQFVAGGRLRIESLDVGIGRVVKG